MLSEIAKRATRRDATRREKICGEVLDEVCHVMGVTHEELTSTSRLRRLVEARMIAARELYKTGITYDQMAVMLKRTRSTLIHACEKYFVIRDQDSVFAADARECARLCRIIRTEYDCDE